MTGNGGKMCAESPSLVCQSAKVTILLILQRAVKLAPTLLLFWRLCGPWHSCFVLIFYWEKTNDLQLGHSVGSVV